MKGQLVCKNHGGKNPRAIANARARLEAANAERAVRTFGLPVVIDHQQALLEELHRTAGAVEWLGVMVAGLDADDVVWGRTRVKDGGDDRGTTHEASVNVWVQLWQRERRHLLDVVKACHAAGIAERLVELEVAKVRLVAVAFGRALDALGASPAQREVATRVLLAELRSNELEGSHGQDD